MEIARRTGQTREVIRRIRVAAEKTGELPVGQET
jgi:predicted transcriptional regulator